VNVIEAGMNEIKELAFAVDELTEEDITGVITTLSVGAEDNSNSKTY
jgi:hypothetical protein